MDIRRPPVVVRLMIILVVEVALQVLPAVSAERDEDGAKFRDEPAARKLYDQMNDAIAAADSLSYVSQYSREVVGKAKTACTYRVWLKKPNYYRMESQTVSGEQGGVLIGDGKTLWIHWPNGRPPWPSLKETKEDEKTRFISYMTKPAPRERISLLHESVLLGGGMSFPIVQPSIFHGYVDKYPLKIDAVRSIGTKSIDGEACRGIEVSVLDHQRSWYLWLSAKDHLPRKLKEVVRLADNNIAREHWTSVKLNDDIPESMFAWEPPAAWTQWKLPGAEDSLLKPGTKAPDFDLASVDGKRIKLTDYRGKVVWLCFWRLGCPPCRKETPFLRDLYASHKEKGLVVLAVNASDDREITLDYLRQQGVTFPNILDTSEDALECCDDYGVGGVPLNYLIDRRGIIVDAGFDHFGKRARTALRNVGIDLAEPER